MGTPGLVSGFAAALLAACLAGTAAGQTVVVSPPMVVAAPGQSVTLTARIAGGSGAVRWILRGQRVSGADWGRLVASGSSATYVAPRSPPPGAVVIQVQALGQFGEPVASVTVPVRIAAGRADPGTAPPPQPGPTVTRPPVPRVPPRSDPSTVIVAAVLQAQRQCRAGRGGAADLARAEAVWSGLGSVQRLDTVAAFARAQLGGVRLRVAPPDPRVPNVARVTAERGTVVITFGTAPGSGRSVLDEPLTRPASLGWSHASLLDFLCYENEVARIRSRIDRQCRRMYDAVKARLDRGGAYAADASDAGQAARQIAAYRALMASSGRREDERMSASWLFERIAVERGRGARSCDMPAAAGGPGYNQAIAGALQFEHDTLATRRGRAFCPCPR